MHDKGFGLVKGNIILGGLDALVTLEQGVETIPSFLGGGTTTDVSNMLSRKSLLDDVNSRLVELGLNVLSWSQIAWVMRMKSMNNTSPQ